MINEIVWENSTKSKYVKILMNNPNIMFGLSLPLEKLEKSKNIKRYI